MYAFFGLVVWGNAVYVMLLFIGLQDYKKNAFMEADLQCSKAIQSMEKRLRAACNASDAKIDNVAKVIVEHQ